MANRNTLHISKLEAFKNWLIKDGWEILPLSKNPYEVLRASKMGISNPLIVYSGKSKEHLSFANEWLPVVEAFLHKKTNADRIRSMTENEAIEELKYDCNEIGKAIPCDTSWGESFENAYEMAINALEEVQQYRQIGKISTCKNAVEICKAMIERGIDPDNIAEYIKFEDNLMQRGYDLKRLLEMMEKHKQYCQIGTVEECREAVEKQTAISREIIDGKYFCPKCHNLMPYPGYCGCGQKVY